MRWFSIKIDDRELEYIAASDLVGAVVWVWDNPSTRTAKSIIIKEHENNARGN